MTDIRMIAVLLIAFLISCYHQQALSDPIVELLVTIGRKISMLDNGLADIIQDVLYERRQVAQASGNYPMLALVAEIAKMEMSLHRYEQDALMNAALIIEKYQTPEISESLANLTLSRMIHQVSTGELDLEQTRRKKIYLLFKSYDYEPDVKKLALDYSLRIKAKEARALKAKALLDQALLTFEKDVSAHVSDREQSETMQLVDDFIKEAKASLVDSRQTAGTNEWMSIEIDRASREAMDGKMMQLPAKAIEAVRMDDVLAYEDQLVRSYLDAAMESTCKKLTQLDNQFKRTIEEVYNGPQEMAKVDGNKGLMAFSARIAEAEALMHAIEDRMLTVVREALKQYFVFKYRQLDGSLMANLNLIELIVQRSTERAIESGFVQLQDYRKGIYVSLEKYDQSAPIKDLARKFALSLNARKRKQAKAHKDASAILKKYINDVLFVLTEHQLAHVLDDVDQFIDEALERHDFVVLQDGHLKKFAELDQSNMIEQYVKGDVFDDIMAAKRVDNRIDQYQIASVDMKDVQAADDLLLAT